MTNDEKWKYVADVIAAMRKVADTHSEAVHKLMIAPESPLVDPCHRFEGMLISTLEHLVGDCFQAISWFVYECDYGRKSMEAGCSGSMRKIETVDDLRWLTELNCT